MDYIFKDWEKKMSAFESSVEKDLVEIRKCKADMQEMRRQMHEEINGSYYVRDLNRIILSAPEIILGNVDQDGVLYNGAVSKIVLRGTQVDLQASGDGSRVETRAASIRQIAENPGTDGHEHVVGAVSEVISQARSIVIQSDDADGAFPVPATPTGCGLRIHADNQLEISASLAAESKEKQLDNRIKSLESRKSQLKDQASVCKDSFKSLVKELEELMEEKEKLVKDDHAIRGKYNDVEMINLRVEDASEALAEETRSYSAVLAMLSETNRLLKCLKDMKSKIKKGDDYLQKSTGSSVAILGERIGIASVDGDGNLRDNPGSGISIKANEVSIASVEANGKLKEKGQVSIKAMNVEVATAGTADAAYDDKGELTTATYAAEGDFKLRSKNITIEGVDYEIAESKPKEKQLTADSRIKLRAKTIEVSTESSANIEGDLLVRSKTVTVESTDADGKATGSVSINAKAIAMKSMDTDKESHADSALAAGSTMVLVSEKMSVGAVSKDVKSKKLQTISEEMGLFADKTLEAQQGEGKAVVQLSDGNAAFSGSKTQLFGETTVNANTEIKGEIKAPKASIDAVEAKSALKSPNIQDGMAAGAPGGGGSLSVKLQVEEVKSEE